MSDQELAERVAEMLPQHLRLSTPAIAELTDLIRQLGGRDELMRWLAGHPGRPRLVAQLYDVIDFFDRVGGDPDVIKRLADLRATTADPIGAAGHIAPETDEYTLPGAAFRIEQLLAERRDGEALALASALLDMLDEVARDEHLRVPRPATPEDTDQ